MIKKLLLPVFLFFVVFMNAQSVYQFETENISYQDLVGSISLNNGQIWDDPDFIIPLGFNFMIGSAIINTIYLNEDGLGGGLSTNQNGSGNIGLVFPIGQDLIDLGFGLQNSLSPISYKTQGNLGSQITVIEWKNAGFFDDSTESDFINFQVWMYEGSNKIEYRYGPNQVNNPSESYEGFPGPLVALFPKINSNSGYLFETGYLLDGNPQNPTVLVFEPGDEIREGSLSGTIPNGTVYRFTPQPLSTEDLTEIDFQIYPNPTSEYLVIQTKTSDYNISIYNSLGQKMNVSSVENKIDVSIFSNGLYYIKVEIESGSTTKKFVKQ